MSKRRPQPDDELMTELFAIAEALYRPGPERDAAAARFGEVYSEHGAPGRFELLSPDTASFLLNVAYRIAMKSGKPEQARDLALRFFTHPRAETAVAQDEQQFMRYLGATATYRCGADSEALVLIRPVLEQGRLPYQRSALYTVRAVLLEYCEYHAGHPEKVVSEDFVAVAEETYRRLRRSKSTRRRLPQPATVRDVYQLLDFTFPNRAPNETETGDDSS